MSVEAVSECHPLERPGTPACLNGLLRDFGPKAAARLLDGARAVELAAGQSLYEPGQSIGVVYFPEDGAVSLSSMGVEGASAESAVIGSEGAVGLAEGLAQARSPWSCRVILPGMAWAASASSVSEVLRQDPVAGVAAWRYFARLDAERHQALVCAALHSGGARLARILLEWADRTGGSRLPLTQEKLAAAVGVRRTTVTLLMSDLMACALVDTGRGRVTVLDPDGLEARACSCRRRGA